MIFKKGQYIRSGYYIAKITDIVLELREYRWDPRFAWMGMYNEEKTSLSEVDTNSVPVFDKTKRIAGYKRTVASQIVSVKNSGGFFNILPDCKERYDKEYRSSFNPIDLLDVEAKDMVLYEGSGIHAIDNQMLFFNGHSELDQYITEIWTRDNQEGFSDSDKRSPVYRLMWKKEI